MTPARTAPASPTTSPSRARPRRAPRTPRRRPARPPPIPQLALRSPQPLALPPLPAGTPRPAGRGGRTGAARRRQPRRTAPAARATAAPTVSGEPRYTLFEGTVIETVLTNRLDGTFSGPVNCLVSVPVYAADHLVIPAGARVLGEARAVNTFGQSRLAVVFHRVILPNGAHVNLDSFHGLNQVGDLGLRDQVDRHYAQIFGVSLALGAIAGFAQGQSGVGFDATALDTYRQGVGRQRLAVERAHSRSVSQPAPDRDDSGGPSHQGVSLEDLELPAYRDPLRLTGGRP